MAVRPAQGGAAVSATELNAFLRMVTTEPDLQARLRTSDARSACDLATAAGFEVTVGDLIRYKARATSWSLRDDELEVVAQWQDPNQPFWWQHIWPDPELDSSRTSEGDSHD